MAARAVLMVLEAAEAEARGGGHEAGEHTPLGCVKPDGGVSVEFDTSDIEVCARGSLYLLAIDEPDMPSQGQAHPNP